MIKSKISIFNIIVSFNNIFKYILDKMNNWMFIQSLDLHMFTDEL